MTGLWQGQRQERPRVRTRWCSWIIYYIETWSLGLDIRILLRTLPAVLSADGAF